MSFIRLLCIVVLCIDCCVTYCVDMNFWRRLVTLYNSQEDNITNKTRHQRVGDLEATVKLMKQT